MTLSEFLAFYPQFAGLFPEPVLEAYLAGANARFASWEEDAEEGRRLYMAHRLTLYAKTVPAGYGSGGSQATSTYAGIASAGDGSKITSKKVDGVAVTYSSGDAASASSASKIADLAETIYGNQLLSLLRLHSGPIYIP